MNANYYMYPADQNIKDQRDYCQVYNNCVDMYFAFIALLNNNRDIDNEGKRIFLATHAPDHLKVQMKTVKDIFVSQEDLMGFQEEIKDYMPGPRFQRAVFTPGN